MRVIVALAILYGALLFATDVLGFPPTAVVIFGVAVLALASVILRRRMGPGPSKFVDGNFIYGSNARIRFLLLAVCGIMLLHFGGGVRWGISAAVVAASLVVGLILDPARRGHGTKGV
jgi:hypothetical protein